MLAEADGNRIHHSQSRATDFEDRIRNWKGNLVAGSVYIRSADPSDEAQRRLYNLSLGRHLQDGMCTDSLGRR